MTKPKVLFQTFKLPIFEATIWVIVANTLQAGIEYARDKTSEIILKDEDIKGTAAYTYAYCSEKGVKQYILFFKYNTSPGTIAHETKHLINILFSWHGYKLSISNDEMECYYLGNIVDKVYKIVNIYKTKFVKKRKKVNAILSAETLNSIR